MSLGSILRYNGTQEVDVGTSDAGGVARGRSICGCVGDGRFIVFRTMEICCVVGLGGIQIPA